TPALRSSRSPKSSRQLHRHSTRSGTRSRKTSSGSRRWRWRRPKRPQWRRPLPKVTSPRRPKRRGAEGRAAASTPGGSPFPEVGVSSTLDGAVFSLKAGETTGPIPTENAVVVAHVRERQDLNPATMTSERESIRGQLLEQRRGEFFAAYMAKAKAKMKVG